MDTEIIRRVPIRSVFQHGQRLNHRKYPAVKTLMQEVPEERVPRPGIRVLQLWRVPIKDSKDGIIRDTSFKGKLSLWGGLTSDKPYMIHHLRKLALPLDEETNEKEYQDHDAVLDFNLRTGRRGVFSPQTIRVVLKFAFYSEEQAAKNSILEASGTFRISGLPESHPLQKVVYEITAWIQSTVKNIQTNDFCWGPDTFVRRVEMRPCGVSRRQDLDLDEVANSLISSTSPLSRSDLKQELVTAVEDIDVAPRNLYVKGCTCDSRKDCPFCCGSVPAYERCDPAVRTGEGSGIAVPLFPTICADQLVSALDTSLSANRASDPPLPIMAHLRSRSRRLIGVLGAGASETVASFAIRLIEVADEERELSMQNPHSIECELRREQHHRHVRSLDADLFFTHQNMQQSIPPVASFDAEIALLAKGPATLDVALREGLRYTHGGLDLASRIRRLLEGATDCIAQIDLRVAPDNFENLIIYRRAVVRQWRDIQACMRSISAKLSGAAPGGNRRIGQRMLGQCPVVWYPQSGERFASYRETVQMLRGARERAQALRSLVATTTFNFRFSEIFIHDLLKLGELQDFLSQLPDLEAGTESCFTGELIRNFNVCVSEFSARLSDFETIISDDATPEWQFNSEPEIGEEQWSLQPASWAQLQDACWVHQNFDMQKALMSIPAVAELVRAFPFAELCEYMRENPLPIIFWPEDYDDPAQMNSYRSGLMNENVVFIRAVRNDENEMVPRLLLPPWMLTIVETFEGRGQLTLTPALQQSIDLYTSHNEEDTDDETDDDGFFSSDGGHSNGNDDDDDPDDDGDVTMHDIEDDVEDDADEGEIEHVDEDRDVEMPDVEDSGSDDGVELDAEGILTSINDAERGLLGPSLIRRLEQRAGRIPVDSDETSRLNTVEFEAAALLESVRQIPRLPAREEISAPGPVDQSRLNRGFNLHGASAPGSRYRSWTNPHFHWDNASAPAQTNL